MNQLTAAAIVVGCILASDLLAGWLGYKLGFLEATARKLLPKTATADQIVDKMHQLTSED